MEIYIYLTSEPAVKMYDVHFEIQFSFGISATIIMTSFKNESINNTTPSHRVNKSIKLLECKL